MFRFDISRVKTEPPAVHYVELLVLLHPDVGVGGGDAEVQHHPHHHVETNGGGHHLETVLAHQHLPGQ